MGARRPPPWPATAHLEDVFSYAQVEGVQLRLDAAEVQARRPAAGQGSRRAFLSGKKNQNTMKATVIADHQGRTLWTDALRPGLMHDVTAARTDGSADASNTSTLSRSSSTTATSASDGITRASPSPHLPHDDQE
ncbi:transposase family protein [Streptomyces sp. NPDC048442]|uniref:transposase family protein n=1 Tax=Streptomyces sp. NPDC048442 TaxID=3154823 RepID=UPI003446889D